MNELSENEAQRISDIIGAARSRDWRRFLSLSDKPFRDSTVMKAQFDDCCQTIPRSAHPSLEEVAIVTYDDGTRMINSRITVGDIQEIVLTLHSASNGSISIWGFARGLD